MHSSIRIKLISIFATVILSFCFTSCKKNGQISSSKPFVWGGTVSHHALANDYIEDFFKTLSNSRKIKTFFIICPSHYGLSTYEWSVANGTWKTDDGKTVQTDLKKAQQIASVLNVDFDPQVFTIEHGISTLTPFIHQYFPEAKIVAIAVHGEPPMNVEYANKLYNSIKPFFTDKTRKDNFLMISTDFSHHGNQEQTKIKDERSALFFNNLSKENWIMCGCDNRPGIYTMSRFINEKTKVNYLKHTTSYEICGEGEDDITSYYFSLLGDI